MKRTSSILSCLALVLATAAGCKTDPADPTTTASPAREVPSAHPPRSGKIELDRPMVRREAPSLAEAEPEAPTDPEADRAERRARWEQRREERMARIDTDGDGKVSDAERAAARAQRVEDMKARFDGDGDGKLTVAELGETRMFRRGGDPKSVDTNGDGVISSEELSAGMETMRGQFRGPPRGDEGERPRGPRRRDPGGGSATP